MKKEKQKPSYSAFSTALWVIKNRWKYVRASFVALFLMIPVYVIEQSLLVLLPQQVVALIVDGESYQTILAIVALLVGGICLMKTITVCNTNMKWVYSSRLRQEMNYQFNMKHMSINYMTTESPKFQNRIKRAQETLWSSGLWSPLTQLSEEFTIFIRSIIGYILFGTVLSFASPWITVLLTISALISYGMMQLYTKYEYQNRDNWTPIDRKINYLLYGSRTFETAKDIRIYGLNHWFTDMYQQLTKQRLSWDHKLLYKSFSVGLVDLVLILLRDGLGYAFLITMTLNGEISADEFVLYFAAIGSFATWVGDIVRAWNRMHAENLKVCDLRDIIEWKEEPWWATEEEGTDTAAPKAQNQTKTAHEAGTPNTERARSIDIDHLTFCYEGAEKPVLRNIDVHIKPGEKIAIVGLNGAGKTTLIKNICGLYQPTEGEIKINGVKQKAYTQKAYMKLFSVVFQDFLMLSTGIGEMVASAAPENVDKERVRHCLELAGLWERIESLPEGMDTPLNKQVYENGVDLSGGEKQKLMLAKAIYKNAPILILDEPTAALDPIAENEMYLRYNELTEGRTSIFISHRLSSTRFCDRILFMEDGQIVEEGSHEELMAAGGKYAHMFDVQSQYYQDKEGCENEE